ncbi:MAG TPA: hypothetical protein VGP47_10370 [Parachlamydiaceae bacterium]|nr:hypothetical protein [Nitrosopumilus sp.]HEV8052888.1 hypothetical protein [Parachlamydiaceae bacterium]
MKLNIYQKICLAFFIVIVGLWISLFVTKTTDGFYNYLYSFLFGIIPLLGGLVAMYQSRIWGGFKSTVGKAVFFIGLGIFCWGVGEMIWSYYNFIINVPAPYPSLADIGFAPSIFFYGLGSVYLAHATGAKFGLRNKFAKIFLVIAPIFIWIFAYYILVTVARNGVLVPEGETTLKFVLDIVYPFGGFVSLTLAVIISGLSFRYLGGRFKFDVISILIGLAVMFVADSVFSYTTTVGTYYNGNFGDLLLASGQFFLTYGVLGFCTMKGKY